MKILNLGSLNLDYVYKMPHFVRPGETLAATHRAVFAGGKGLNQSVALAKAGTQVYHGGAVGMGDSALLLEVLQQCGVNTQLLQRLDMPTGHAIIQVDDAGQNCILLYSGANGGLTTQMVDAALQGFVKGDWLLLQNEINQMPYILAQARQQGMQVVLNPSPISPQLLQYPLEYVDYFILNEVEAADICGISNDQAGEALLQQVTAKFPTAKVVLTLGSRGAMYYDGTKTYYQQAYKVETVDTTAAGDCFTGYFFAQLVAGTGPQLALQRAAKAAAIAVSRPGASASIPTLAEVLANE